MIRRMHIVALGLVFGVAVPVVSAARAAADSTVTAVSPTTHSSQFITGKNPKSEIRNPKFTLIGPPSPVPRPSVVAAQHPGPRPIAPADRGGVTAPAKPHRTGELECRLCHVDKHQGVLRMYLGTGGRGTPMIPSHMFQVRVACIACHIVPKEPEREARIVGQTFRPGEQACINCHGEKYRGMLEKWADTLDRMRGAVAPKLKQARKALRNADPKSSKLARAVQLVDDAEFNIEFVALGRGVHNVFYAADLLKLANAWLDEALRILGKTPVRTDDVLVRGKYCGVLCHEQARVQLPVMVTFGKRKVPHLRHITEFGAVCTVCHSAEVHKAVTATPATCTSCHHSPQNAQCESCHRTQAAFYEGKVKTDLAKIEPNVMAPVVGCTGCHDLTKEHSRKTVGEQCLACHDEAYSGFVEDWTTGFDTQVAQATEAIKRAEAALGKARRAGHKATGADALVKDAHKALSLVKDGRGVHNPVAADALLEAARRKAEQALAQAGSQ